MPHIRHSRFARRYANGGMLTRQRGLAGKMPPYPLGPSWWPALLMSAESF
jgi:hypothetical protein